MAVELITYSGKTVTAMNDAIVNDSEMGASGILYGCEVSASGNVITILGGYGVIKGRLFRITTTTLNATLTSSQSYGQVYVMLDLSNTSAPISFHHRSGASGYVDLIGDDDANYTNGNYFAEIARYEASPSAITEIHNTARRLSVNKPTVYMDIAELGLTSPVTVADLYAALPKDSVAYISSNVLDSTTIPSTEGGILEIIKFGYETQRHGKSILFRQGKSGNDARMYVDTYGNLVQTWHIIPRDEDVFYQSGEDDTLVCQGGGFVTSSSTSIRFFVNYSKLKGNVTRVTLVDGSIIARQNGQYIAGDSSGSMALDSRNTSLMMRNNGLMVNVTNSSGFSGATNNSPVAVYAVVMVQFS